VLNEFVIIVELPVWFFGIRNNVVIMIRRLIRISPNNISTTLFSSISISKQLIGII